MKRVLASFFIILIAAAAVFLIGWVQFGIKPGECGVMVSKTSGVLEKPLLPGSFVWRWEKLLPTNVTIHTFSMEPHRSVQTYSGSLPGSDLYSKMLDAPADFSYELEVAVQLSPKAESLVTLVKRHEIASQEDLAAYLDNKAKVVAGLVADRMLPSVLPSADSSSRWTGSLSAKALDKATLDSLAEKSADDLAAVTLNAVEISKARLPDMTSYEGMQELYGNYREELNRSLQERAARYADEMHESEKSVKLLEQYAELLKKYPQLKDLGTIQEVSKTLKGLPASSEGIESLAGSLPGGTAGSTGAGSSGAVTSSGTAPEAAGPETVPAAD